MGGIPIAERVVSQAPVAFQPSAEALRSLALESPAARQTGLGSVNVQTRVAGRLRRSTFLVGDGPMRLPGPTILPADGERLAALQDAHLTAVGSVVVDGFLGAPGPLRTATRVVTEAGTAWLAGMHRHLLFDPVAADPSFAPQLTVVSTPTLQVAGAPDGAMIAVWPDEGVTRVLGTDFFGETKKAATRMWAERVY
ncbi:MAG: phosphoenolpyruvate carboxykinase (ATP), partial [Actinomycetes bacterium]